MSGRCRVLPWSDSCFVCGDSNPMGLNSRFTVDDETGRVLLETAPELGHEGYPGQLHGGVITAMLDETIGWACTVRKQRFCVTVELTVRFRRPVPSGTALRVIGICESADRRIVTGHGWIEDSEGLLLASAKGRFAAVTEGAHRQVLTCLKMPDRTATPEDI